MEDRGRYLKGKKVMISTRPVQYKNVILVIPCVFITTLPVTLEVAAQSITQWLYEGVSEY